MFGFDSFEDIEGMSLLDLVGPQYVDEFKQLLKSLSKGEPAPPRYELEARDIEGNPFPAVMEFTPALYEGEPCLQVVLRRQETDPELAREVEELRQRDQVTGLLNRPTFLHALEDAVASAAQNQGQHGLLLLEPDHYQRLLQDIGLDSADAILAAIAERVRGVLDGALANGSAVAARFGEHSLAVLLRGDHLATVALAERLLEAFASHVFEIGSRSANITASIGGVQIGEKIASVTQVLAKANHGVQSSIGVGGNRFDIFDPSAVDRAEEERIQAWVSRLRDALDRDRFLLHYQPVISLQGEPGATYETYIRLDAGAGETVPPLSFLQIAEEHGLLWEIDRWVVGRAIAVIAQRLQAGQPTTLLVKITQASIADDSLTRHIGEQLAEHKIGGEHLVLQLPEAKVFTNLRAAQEFAREVAKLGCRVGLEQFGVGLDSFQLLSHFDPAFLKLDRSFMEDLPKNAANQQRVREIANKAHALGIKSIAEFVQDAGSMSILFSSGIDYVEGYFLAPAGPEMNYDFE
jgi:diguanylate cyclase (GGDEF)-like protein